jgi:Aminotransferase class I and II
VYTFNQSLIEDVGTSQIPYYLDEDNDWSLDISELQKSLDAAREHCIPRAIVVINPGNPTGIALNFSYLIKTSVSNNYCLYLFIHYRCRTRRTCNGTNNVVIISSSFPHNNSRSNLFTSVDFL